MVPSTHRIRLLIKILTQASADLNFIATNWLILTLYSTVNTNIFHYNPKTQKKPNFRLNRFQLTIAAAILRRCLESKQSWHKTNRRLLLHIVDKQSNFKNCGYFFFFTVLFYFMIKKCDKLVLSIKMHGFWDFSAEYCGTICLRQMTFAQMLSGW